MPEARRQTTSAEINHLFKATSSSKGKYDTNHKVPTIVIVHFMRHAEAKHKANNKFAESIYDPDLTNRGYSQCENFRKAFPDRQHIDYVWCSPMSRTINTAMACFPFAKIKALPILQNSDTGPNGTGKAPEILQKSFGFAVDLREVKTGWNLKQGDRNRMSWKTNKLLQKLQKFGQSCKDPIVEIVVVSHGSFLNSLTDTPYWDPVELRSYRVQGQDVRPLYKESLSKFRYYHTPGRNTTGSRFPKKIWQTSNGIEDIGHTILEHDTKKPTFKVSAMIKTKIVIQSKEIHIETEETTEVEEGIQEL